MAHFAGKGTASGAEIGWTVSEGIPSDGRGTFEGLRQHRGLSEELYTDVFCTNGRINQLDPVDVGEEAPPENSRESTLRKEVSQLKRLLAEKTMEVDFFERALQKVEARQKSGSTGEKESTKKSEKGCLCQVA
jgi:hypothetical protein